MKRNLVLVLSLCAGLAPAAWSGSPGEAPSRYAIRAGTILTVTGEIIKDGVVLVKNGKIERVSGKSAIPSGYRTIDAPDRWLLPGFVDAHSHSGGEGWGDINDAVYQINPDLRILDVIALNTPQLKRAVAAGITTINFIPGSASNNGGTGIVMKTAGDDLDAVIVRFPGVLKIAQAGNPERALTGELGAGRMGMTWQLRMLMQGLKAYHDAWSDYRAGRSAIKPEVNIAYEDIQSVFNGFLPVFVHSAWFQPVQAVFRMYLEEFGIRTAVITHGEFGAYRNGPAIARRAVSLDCGPRLYDFEEGSFRGIATEYARAGVRSISLNTDSYDDAEERLPLQAAMAVRLGLDEDDALEGITINAARVLGLDGKIGSIAPGKDADLVLWTGNPLDVRNSAVWVMVDGKVVYDLARDEQRY